jgi:thymidylate synthase (FAD)
MGRKTLHVELLRYTPDSEEIIAMGAKLCYSGADIDTLMTGIQKRDQSGFIEKLVDMGHYSPIEHASFTFGIEGVSRSLLAQITRHRIASFSVQSQRYVGKQSSEKDPVFGYIIPPRIEALGVEYTEIFEKQMEQMQVWYDQWQMLLGGSGESANEDARFVLPNASETKMMVTMNARELMHFFRVRCCRRAQWEIRALADEMLRLAKVAAPVLFKNAGPACLTEPCPEGNMSCGKMVEVRAGYGKA